MRRLEITNPSVLLDTIKAEISRTHEARFLHRLHCVLLVARGYSCYQVARWFGEHPCNVERWVRHVEEFGPYGLRDEQKTGRPPRVRDDQRQQLQREIRQSPSELGYERSHWDGKLLQAHLAHRYGIELSIRQCQRLLRRLENHAAARDTPAG